MHISGAGHSGSTIFGGLAGQLDGYFYVGELAEIWRGIGKGTLCGCGQPYHTCEVWSAVFEQAYGGFAGVDAAWMEAQTGHLARAGSLRALLTNGAWDAVPGRDEYVDITRRLYETITHVTGCQVVVDSQKNAWYGALLATRMPVGLYVAHLVRDARGVTFSLYKKYAIRHKEITLSVPRYYLRTARGWLLLNLGAELVWRKLRASAGYRRFRYEDYVPDPETMLGEITRFTGVGPQRTSVDALQFKTMHTVEGNRVRLQSGRVELKLDADWHTNMDRKARALVTATTLPLLVRYGYPVLPGKG